MNLEELLGVFHKYLYLPDTGAIEVTLGAVAANRLAGDPVWLLLVGPPSSGKTEILSSLSQLDDIHEVSTITQAGLLSGSLGKGDGVTGGLLAELRGFGIIACKDFTSILSQSPDSRTTLLAALREVYDGSWVRRVGTSGGQTFAWSGKVGFVGCVTEVIDLHSSAIGAMGERFVFFRLPELRSDQRLELGCASMRLTGNQKEMRIELAKAVNKFFDGLLKQPGVQEMTEEQEQRLVLLADLATKCRSSVERSGHDREIELVPQPESLGRLQAELLQLSRGLTSIGVGPDRIEVLLTQVALDGMSKNRRAIILHFLGEGQNLLSTTREVEIQLRLPTPVTHRTLEDLASHGVVEKVGSSGADCWRASEWLRDRYEALS